MEKVLLTVSGKKVTVDFDNHFSSLAKVNDSLNKGVHNHYQKSGLVYVDVPEIVGITGACENVDTLFKVNNRFDIPLFFSQTGQLSLEQALQSVPGAYTIIHSGRDEEKDDERHLRQFRLTEEEFGCTLENMTRQTYDEDKMFEALLKHIQLAIQAMVKHILVDQSQILKKVYHRDVSKLEQMTKKDFYRISYEDAIEELNRNGFPSIHFGDDLQAAHEAAIVKFLNKKNEEIPVFIMKYPKEIKFFNMKVSAKDPRVVLSADLIMPYSGEATGSAVREDDFEKLKERLLTSNMFRLHTQRGGKYEDFIWYLNIVRSKKTNPHAGYGIGNERVMQCIFAEKDIRNISMFALLNKQTGDWDKNRYGQASIVTTAKKNHILMSIGKPSDKQYLLSHIKSLAKSDKHILYATKKTHDFLKKNGVLTSLVYKISQVGRSPNIGELMTRRIFDLVINIPTRDKIKNTKEFTDGKLIRRGAVSMGISLVTDPEVASELISNLTTN